MNDSVPQASASLMERLQAHRTLANAPTSELEWLIAHGKIERYVAGEFVVRKGEAVMGLYLILKGRVSHYMDQGGTWRKVIDWRDGEATGQLPYSRMASAPGNSVADEATEALFISRDDVRLMARECPHVTEALVHSMVDRARTFKSSDLQVEKMASLGKLAAGLAHELNNPASAAARSAEHLGVALGQSEVASRALAGVEWTTEELSTLDRVRGICLNTYLTNVLSPLERSDREEEIAGWLATHDTEEELSAPLVETGAKLETLDQLAAALSGEKLGIALRWIAAGCTMRQLARDLERAATRMHQLVSAVKGFTYMDHATVPAPVDVEKGLADTVSMLAAKARGKSASVTLEVPADLPRVSGFGGELNQVWLNLLDNAIDAIASGGHVTVSATGDEKTVKVRVIDDGPGIPTNVVTRIFDPFFTTKGVGKGTGLGLDMARRLVDSNAGSIDVDSVPGRTEFRVTLPRSP
ncbi:MAG: ATP-binding protein [Gemmatimonadaceae bacterium]